MAKKIRKSLSVVLAVMMLISVSVTTAFASPTPVSGTISGTVKLDGTGVSNAAIKVNGGTYTATTGASGAYSITVPVSTTAYSVTATYGGTTTDGENVYVLFSGANATFNASFTSVPGAITDVNFAKDDCRRQTYNFNGNFAVIKQGSTYAILWTAEDLSGVGHETERNAIIAEFSSDNSLNGAIWLYFHGVPATGDFTSLAPNMGKYVITSNAPASAYKLSVFNACGVLDKDKISHAYFGSYVRNYTYTCSDTSSYPAAGTLTINKTVSGLTLSESKAYTFTITSGQYQTSLTVTVAAGATTGSNSIILPTGTYTVTENGANVSNVSGYTLTTSSDPTTGIVNLTTDGASVSFTNTYTPITVPQGTLTINKTVVGLDVTSKDYTFIISGADIETQTLTVTAIETLDGIKGSNSVTLPTGDYTVTESGASVSGYTLVTISDPSSGSVSLTNDGASVSFTNTYTPETNPPVEGTLTINKTAVGLDVASKDYTFTITGANIETKTLTVTAATKTLEGITGSNSVSLPTGDYTVTESGASVSGYTLVTISDPSSGSVLLTNDGATVSFTNTYTPETNPPVEGTLTINKTVAGLDVASKDYTFTISGENIETQTLTVTAVKTLGIITGSNSVSLPVGTYTVTENSADVSGYTLVTTLGGFTEGNSINLTNDGASISFTNTYTPVSQEMVSYQVTHKYYTSVDGGAYSFDGYKTSTESVPVGTVINPSDPLNIARDPSYNDSTYTFISVTPSTSVTINTSGTEFVLEYHRSIITQQENVSYTVTHKYYTSTDGGAYSLDGSTSSTITVSSGTTVNPSAIAKVTSYGGNSYTYFGVTPTTSVTITVYGTEIVLEYHRSQSIHTETETYYNITVNYLEKGTNKTLASSYFSGSILAGSAYNVTDKTQVEISGYDRDSVEGTASGTLNSNVIINVYYTLPTEIPETNPPLTETPEAPEIVDIAEVLPPLADVPATGDTNILVGALAAAVISATAIIALAWKRREDN